jgi:hypothetical protein
MLWRVTLLLAKLPEEHFHLLKRVLGVMRKVLDNGQKNGVTIELLAQTIGHVLAVFYLFIYSYLHCYLSIVFLKTFYACLGFLLFLLFSFLFLPFHFSPLIMRPRNTNSSADLMSTLARTKDLAKTMLENYSTLLSVCDQHL